MSGRVVPKANSTAARQGEAAPVSTQQVFAAALLNPQADCPEGLKSWNRSDPARRFDVYRNNVVSSLIDALADTFPVLQELVGEEFFRAMARAFVPGSPPSSAMLVRYGEGFADFVSSFAPARSLPYLGDVARLEMARVQAYHAADVQSIDAPALARAMSQPELVERLVATLHPSLRVLRSRHAIVSLWSAHHGELDISQVDAGAAEDAMVLRRDLEVLVLCLPAGAAVFVQALSTGESLGTAAARAQLQDDRFDLNQCLEQLLRLGAICTLE